VARTIDQAKRNDIAARAFKVVLERGVQDTTMSDIAKAMKMNRSTLYWYFSDLGALFDTVVGDIEGRVLTHVIASMGRHKHPIDQLVALIEGAVSFYENEQNVLQALVQLWAIRSHDADSLIERQRRVLQPQREFLIRLVQQGISSGRIRECDVNGVVDTVLTVLDGAVFRRVTLNQDPNSVISFVRDSVLGPLKIETKGSSS
jgi:AcrR family transcriptional regulator